jgi:hypothetical protein
VSGENVSIGFEKPTARSVTVQTSAQPAAVTERGLVSMKGPKGDTGAQGPVGPMGPVPIVVQDTAPVDHALLWVDTTLV